MSLSDQKFSCRTSDGRFGTVTDFDGTSTSGSLQFQAKFSSEGLDIYVPGNGIRFETGVYLDLTTTDSVTIGYTG